MGDGVPKHPGGKRHPDPIAGHKVGTSVKLRQLRLQDGPGYGPGIRGEQGQSPLPPLQAGGELVHEPGEIQEGERDPEQLHPAPVHPEGPRRPQDRPLQLYDEGKLRHRVP